MKVPGLCLIALGLLMALPSQAQIGKDAAAADRIYGSPVAIGKDSAGFVQRAYRKGGRDVIATIVDGVIKRLVFRKYGGEAFTYDELITIARRERMRVSNNRQLPKEGQAWFVGKGTDETRAVYDPEANTFTITKDSYYKARDEKMRSQTLGKKETGR